MTNTTKTTNRATARATAEELYNTAEKAVYIALRARHEKSGLKFLAELQNAQATDKQCRKAEEIADQLTPLENQLEDLQKDLADLQELKAEADRQANKLTSSAELRTQSANYSATLNRQIILKKYDIEHVKHDIADLYKLFNNTFSDRADLTQTAILKLLDLEQNPAPLTQSILAVYGVEDAEELTPTERADAQNTANFRAVINSVGRAVSTIATPEALNRTTTKAVKITPQQAEDFRIKYGGIGSDFKVYANRKRTRASDCYITVEERNTKKQSGFYMITHYKTVAPYSYIEDFTPTDENGENDIAYLKTYNPIIDSFGDLEALEQLFNDCNFTDLERLIIEYYERACRYTDHKEDIIKYIASSLKISKSTIYRHLNNIKAELEPIARGKKLIKDIDTKDGKKTIATNKHTFIHLTK